MIKTCPFLVILALPTALTAAPLCTTASLSDYIAPAFACDFGGATWSGFDFSAAGFATSPVLTPDDITVFPSNPSPGAFGFIFAGSFVADPDDEGTYTFTYNGVASGTFLDTTLFLGGVLIDPLAADPLVSATKTVWTSAGGVLLTPVPPNVSLTSTPPGPATAFAAFAFPSPTIYVEDSLFLRGGSVSASQIANKFTINEIPEAGTVFLLGSGLLALSLFRRRRLV